jgi:hypothetical protein
LIGAWKCNLDLTISLLFIWLWAATRSETVNQSTEIILGAFQSGSDNTAHLKGKLNSLMDMCRQLHELLNTHKKEVQILRSEKETLENVLTMKVQDTRKALKNELHRVNEDITRHYAVMRAESTRLQ